MLRLQARTDDLGSAPRGDFVARASSTPHFDCPPPSPVRPASAGDLATPPENRVRHCRLNPGPESLASALRLITAVALQTTTIWRDHIYLDMSLLDDHYAAAA